MATASTESATPTATAPATGPAPARGPQPRRSLLRDSRPWMVTGGWPAMPFVMLYAAAVATDFNRISWRRSSFCSRFWTRPSWVRGGATRVVGSRFGGG